MKKNLQKKILILLFLLIFLVSCASPTPQPTATSAATFTPTQTLIPTLTPTVTASATLSPTPTEVINYGICTPEQFRDCPIPEEDLFNGKYLAFLRTLSKPFDAAKMKQVPMITLSDGSLIYDISNLPNFEDPSTAPFRRNVTAGMVEAFGHEYQIFPIEYPNPTDPLNSANNVWVIGVRALYNPNTGKPLAGGVVKEGISIWKDGMNIAPIVTSSAYPGTGTIDPLIDMTFQQNGQEEMAARFDRFRNGDTTALDGLVVRIYIARSQNHWFE